MKSRSPDFAFSQPGGATSQPLAHTGPPWDLFLYDVKLFFRNILYLPFIFLPLYPWGSGRLDELYPSASNLVDITLHTVLFFLQLAFLLSLPFLVYIPVALLFTYALSFMGLNTLICWHFNRAIPASGLKSTEDERSRSWERHDDEAWIFLNGICVGCGVIFDFIQCLVQRALSYATLDVRACYVLVKEALLRDDIKKVVFILHSQGGIEGGMIIDWLLEEVDQDYLMKLEVYTFGNLANHFNNPCRNRSSERRTGEGACEGASRTPPAPPSQSHRHRRYAISHIEHYANLYDFASRWGVLNFTEQERPASGKGVNCFMGRLFVNPRAGHQLNQHYLDSIFPLDPTLSFVREPVKGDFMDQDAPVQHGDRGRGRVNGVSEASDEIAYQATDHEGHSGVIYGGSSNGARFPGALKMKDVSRLWQYRNGRVPAEKMSKKLGSGTAA